MFIVDIESRITTAYIVDSAVQSIIKSLTEEAPGRGNKQSFLVEFERVKNSAWSSFQCTLFVDDSDGIANPHSHTAKLLLLAFLILVSPLPFFSSLPFPHHPPVPVDKDLSLLFFCAFRLHGNFHRTPVFPI